MSNRPKYHRFSIARSVESESMNEVRSTIRDLLDSHNSRDYFPKSHLSLFKLSMLNRNESLRYRPPSVHEMQTRVIDQRKPTWEPFEGVTHEAIGAMAYRGCIMLTFKRKKLFGEHIGALHAAKVRFDELDPNKKFEPHITVCRYDESSPESMEQLYVDEEIINGALTKNPISIDFSSVTISGAKRRHDSNRILHTFQPRRISI